MKQVLMWEYYQNQSRDVFLGSRARLKFLANIINPPAKVLNIGIGDGLFERIGREKGLEVYSLDPSEQAIKTLQRRSHIGERAKVGSVEEMPFPDDYFDTVVISEVLEHLSNESLERGLGEISRVLRPGGRVTGTVPAREDLQRQLIVCPECGKRFHRWGHLQSFTVSRVTEMLRQVFVVEKVMERPFVTWGQLNWKGKVMGAIRLLLSSLQVHGNNENIVFIASKRCG